MYAFTPGVLGCGRGVEVEAYFWCGDQEEFCYSLEVFERGVLVVYLANFDSLLEEGGELGGRGGCGC